MYKDLKRPCKVTLYLIGELRVVFSNRRVSHKLISTVMESRNTNVAMKRIKHISLGKKEKR